MNIMGSRPHIHGPVFGGGIDESEISESDVLLKM
jgi:hypothetical protein